MSPGGALLCQAKPLPEEPSYAILSSMQRKHKPIQPTPRLRPGLIVPDVHRPFHDQRAWDLMLQVGRSLRPVILIIMGDFLDCFCISTHDKDPTRWTQFSHELDDARRGLDELDGLGATQKVFIAGNHSDRLRRYLTNKAPELYGLVDIPGLLGLKDRGWSYVPYKKHTSIGKLNLTHDVGNTGRYAVFKALDMYQHSIVTGHSHRLSYVVEGNALGEQKLSAQFGWLGDVSTIDYMSEAKAKKDWALGFGVGYFDPTSGFAYLTPVPIVSYSCVVNGELFRA